jgi:hypothetical protein
VHLDEGAGDLEREERVPVRRRRDANQNRARKDLAELSAQSALQSPDTERAELHPLRPVLGKVPRKRIARGSTVAETAHREEETDTLIVEPTERVRKDAGRRRVQPVDVVDGDEHWALSFEHPKRREERSRYRTLLKRLLGLGPQQRHFDRATLHPRQLWEHILDDAREEVGQRDVGKASLGLRGPSRQDTERTSQRVLDHCSKQRRLPNAGLAADQQPTGLSRGDAVEKAGTAGELSLPTDDLYPCRRASHRPVAGWHWLKGSLHSAESRPCSARRQEARRCCSAGDRVR